MTLTLTRNEFREDGIFSTLTDSAGRKIASTLEHSYEKDGKWLPKILNGTYKCVRGTHRLHSMSTSFTTFEITGVEGHTNLLLHVGNFASDSDGCLLLGESVAKTRPQMILKSKPTFEAFMTLLQGLDSFTLTVI